MNQSSLQKLISRLQYDITCNSDEKFQQKITATISGQFLSSWMTQKSAKTEASFIYPMSHHCHRERERERDQRDMIQHPTCTMGSGGRKRNWKPESESVCVWQRERVYHYDSVCVCVCVCMCVCVCVCNWERESDSRTWADEIWVLSVTFSLAQSISNAMKKSRLKTNITPKAVVVVVVVKPLDETLKINHLISSVKSFNWTYYIKHFLILFINGKFP